MCSKSLVQPVDLTDVDVALKAVREDGLELRRVERKTVVLCKAAVEQNPMALKYVPKVRQTYAMCLAAVTKDPEAAKWIFIQDKRLFPYLAMAGKL